MTQFVSLESSILPLANPLIFHTPVFLPNTNWKSTPAFSMERTEAKVLVWEGHARWINRGKGIQLNRALHNIRDASASINKGTMLAFACDRPLAIAAVTAWRDPVRYAMARA